MLNYNTGISARPPISDAMRNSALAALVAPMPAWDGSGAQNRDDVYSSLAQQNALDYGRAAAAANADFVQRARDLQAQTGQRGASQMGQMQQQQNDLNMRRYQMATDALSGVNSILRDLFR